MSNWVETQTWQAIQSALNAARPAGICIDVGIGEQDFYFEWFANMGYKTVAIDPVASEYVEQLCNQSHVTLYRVALGQGVGVDSLHYTHDGQIRSLLPVWGADWTQDTNTMSLPELWTMLGEPQIAALKLDIEGMEPAIIRQLPAIDSVPCVLAFEIGGLYPFSTGAGRWQDDAWNEVMEAIATLWELGYQKATAYLSGNADYIIHITPGDALDIPLDAEWGNLVFTR